jgi:hypothetical protein
METFCQGSIRKTTYPLPHLFFPTHHAGTPSHLGRSAGTHPSFAPSHRLPSASSHCPPAALCSSPCRPRQGPRRGAPFLLACGGAHLSNPQPPPKSNRPCASLHHIPSFLWGCRVHLRHGCCLGELRSLPPACGGAQIESQMGCRRGRVWPAPEMEVGARRQTLLLSRAAVPPPPLLLLFPAQEPAKATVGWAWPFHGGSGGRASQGRWWRDGGLSRKCPARSGSCFPRQVPSFSNPVLGMYIWVQETEI